VTETVVRGALVQVREDRVGLVGLLEPILGAAVTRILVRVVLEGQCAKRLLDLQIGGVARDPQYVIVIALQPPPPPICE
jgi:hypothetical protein